MYIKLLFLGLVFLLATYTLSIPQLGTEDIGKALEVVFIIFLPNYNLGLALMDMYTNAGYKDTCEGYNYKAVCDYIKAFEPSRRDPCCFPGKIYKQNYLRLTLFSPTINLLFLMFYIYSQTCVKDHFSIKIFL